jgi:hypothetical protein
LTAFGSCGALNPSLEHRSPRPVVAENQRVRGGVEARHKKKVTPKLPQEEDKTKKRWSYTPSFESPRLIFGVLAMFIFDLPPA